MLPLQGKVTQLQDKSFTFNTIICNEPAELKATYWKGKELVEGQEYVLIGNLDNDYLFTVEQHNIKDYPSIAVVGTASYIKLGNKDGRDYVNFSVAVNQSGKTVYYQCKYTLRSEKLVGLFKALPDQSLVEVVGSLKLDTYNDKPKLVINVSNFNKLTKAEGKKETKASDKVKSEDTEFDFAPTKTTTIPDEF